MKYNAYQIAPEYQESPLELFDINEYFDGITVFGNRDFRDYKTREFEQIEKRFDTMADEWNDRAFNGYTAIAELLRDYGFNRPGGGEWTNKQKHAWKLLFESGESYTDAETMLAALELITGKKHAIRVIRGCCQSDWNKVCYPVDDYDEKTLDILETEYFNTGTEWRIVNAEDEDDEVCCYAHEWNDEAIRRELADAVGCKPDEMKLFEFDGWSKTPKYKEIA